MLKCPSYPKVLTLGSAGTEELPDGDVVYQEKVDGSQFGFGVNENGEIVMRSRGQHLNLDNLPKMFRKAVEEVMKRKNALLDIWRSKGEFYIYGEYLEKEKHNVIRYDRIPLGHIIIFDCLSKGGWASYPELTELGFKLNLDVIPQYEKGSFSVDKVKKYLENESFLGGEKVEGIVIKNYTKFINLGGKVMPIFSKYVREQFKERLNKEWNKKSSKGKINEFIESFKSEARWNKALQHLKEQGVLTNSPKDIKFLIQEVHKDIVEEEKENIKKFLYREFIKDILKKAIKGLPEWYKNKLMENIQEKEGSEK